MSKEVNCEEHFMSYPHPAPNGGGGAWTVNTPLSFLHSCSDNCSITFLKILGPGHQRSGQVIPPLKKHSNHVTVVEIREKDLKLLGFGIIPSTYLQLVYLGFFSIGDLRSGQFCDLPLWVNWEKLNASKTYQICSDHSESCSIRLLLMTLVRLRIYNPRKGHWGQIMT